MVTPYFYSAAEANSGQKGRWTDDNAILFVYFVATAYRPASGEELSFHAPCC